MQIHIWLNHDMSKFQSLLNKISGMPVDQLKRVGAKAGVPSATVIKIARGYTKDPGVLTVEKLLKAVK